MSSRPRPGPGPAGPGRRPPGPLFHAVPMEKARNFGVSFRRLLGWLRPGSGTAAHAASSGVSCE
jgi:hypothetical protein